MGKASSAGSEVEDNEGRIAQEELRFVVVHSKQLTHQQTQTYAVAQAKEAQTVADHVQRVQAQWFACRSIPPYSDIAVSSSGSVVGCHIA